MADELTVVSSEPLPDLHVVGSAPLPDQPGFFARAWEQINPAPLIAHPIESAKAIFEQPGIRANQAIEAAKQGNYRLALGRSMEAVPILGMAAEAGEKAAQDIQQGNYGGAAGTVTGLLAAPWLYGGVAKAVPAAVRGAANVAGKLPPEMLPRIGRNIGAGAGAAVFGAPGAIAGSELGSLTGEMLSRLLKSGDAATLDAIAQSLAGKEFSKLTTDQQTAVRTIFQRAQAYERAKSAAPAPQAAPVGPMPEFGEATTPAGKSLTQMIDEELAAKRAAQTQRLVGVERNPAWLNAPEAPAQAAAATPSPLSEIALPSGRIPGGYPGEPVPAAVPPPRVPAWQNLPEAPTAPTAAPAPLSEIALPSGRKAGRAPAEAVAESAPLSKVGTAPGAQFDADLQAALARVRERAAATAEQGAPETPMQPAPAPAPEFQTPALEGLAATEPGPAVNVYKQRAQVLKAQRFANTLEAEGLPFAKTRTWSPDDWKAHAEKVGENAPSQDTVNQILAEQQIRESKQAFESARAEGLSKTERFLAAINERNVTHADSLKWGPGEWNQFAAELGENKPTLKEIQNIRAKLKYQESQAGK